MAKTILPDLQLSEFIQRHQLPEAFVATANSFYLEVLEAVAFRVGGDKKPILLGINGAQGTGKSTLADLVALAGAYHYNWQTIVLSLDDFYLTHQERQFLASTEHPLFATRGVPGTHDIGLLKVTLERLKSLTKANVTHVPRFDKSTDDRVPDNQWTEISGPLDLIILEGWCVGSQPESAQDLVEPVNDLEASEDPDAHWRSVVNDHLGSDYKEVFDTLDMLIFLAAPSFDAVYRWRWEQEVKLGQKSDAPGVMSQDQVRRFIGYYERITRHNLKMLPSLADRVLILDEDHQVQSIT